MTTTSSHVQNNRPTWAPTVELWGFQEITLRAKEACTSPFKDVTLSASFNCNGRTIEVAGFFDGQHTWRIRFMPEDVGAWSFRTHSNLKELDEVTGTFTVGPAGMGNHGPVRVAKVYHFSFADGTPFFPLGTTSYNWLNRDFALQEQTMAALGKAPFTKIRFGLFPKWYPFNRVEPVCFPYVRNPDGTFDLEHFDPEFFREIEKRIRQLETLGVQSDIILFHPYDKWGFAKMDEAHNIAWLKYVTARLASFRSVWWTMCNEYELMTARDWDRLGETVRSNDPYGHPLGIHNIALLYDHKKPWIDHAIMQDGTAGAARTTALARRRYGKPVIVDEYGYEGNNGHTWGTLTGSEGVARHWEITMAGGYASHGETYVHPGPVVFWSAGGELVGESPVRLGFLKEVMISLPFQEMVPAPDLVTHGAALAKPGEAYLFRFPWNLGNNAAESIVQVRLVGTGPFKVDLIEPWRMEVHSLGHTIPGDHAFMLPMKTALLRIVADSSWSGQPESIDVLTSRFIGETSAKLQADPGLFRSQVICYSVGFPIGQLLQNPVTEAILYRYLPEVEILKLRQQFEWFIAIPVSELSKLMKASPEQIQAVQADLEKIPVD